MIVSQRLSQRGSVQVFLNNPFHIVRSYPSVRFFPYLHHGRQSACSNTPETGKGKFSICAGLTNFDIQTLLKLIKYGFSTPHITGRTCTYGYGVLPFRYHAEKGVEGDYSVHLGCGQLHLLCNYFLHFSRQVTKGLLAFVQYID